MSTFDRYAFADYSGSSSLRLQKKHIVLAVSGAEPEHFTREELYLRVCDLLAEATAAGERVVLGFDHSYSFPQGFFEKVTGSSPVSWDEVTALLTGAEADGRGWAARINGLFQTRHGVAVGGPFWGPNFQLQSKRPPFPYAALGMSERRLVEERCRKMKPIYQVGGAGSVGLQAICGIAYLTRLRRFCREQGIPLFAWPFDGWVLPETGHVLVEMYPTLFNHGERGDTEDALACTRWLQREDEAGRLGGYFDPRLTGEERRRAELEGWVLGVDVATK
ncbi:hypothetical protein EV586_102623 [Tumebacillus sp. BK434]|uniref:hypothetical protein n=1 Tax=Tumebacillus sp. BK434 TaxID=2512169 RepID=UPI00104B44DC|nr:hypothetical protein [Tumebacillus sp. BK434]TCP58171.1 hypothetical protein EV586_102623 [Tumebacillus sp. BK434]